MTASPREIRLRIHGMTCAGCVSRVEKALSAVEGIQGARVNLVTETAAVMAGASDSVVRELTTAVREAGYEAEPIAGSSPAIPPEPRSEHRHVPPRTLVGTIALALAVIAIEHLAPLRSANGGVGFAWWRLAQGALCVVLLASPAGRSILAGGRRALVRRTPDMDLLVSMGIAGAFLAGLVSLLAPAASAAHFHAAAMIVAFMTVGRHLEGRARREASAGVAMLAQRIPRTATRIVGQNAETVPVEQIQPGDRVQVADGAMVPVDGRVTSGAAAVDESALTGESVPQALRDGDAVRAGALVREGMITIEATAPAEASAIARMS